LRRAQLVEHVRNAYQTFASGDADAYRAVFSPEIIWHVPGDNPVSGIYRGDEYFDIMPQRMAPLDEWTIVVRDILTNERDRAALVAFHLVGIRRGRQDLLDDFFRA
jgi:ketosteroid isomerase-like protein